LLLNSGGESAKTAADREIGGPVGDSRGCEQAADPLDSTREDVLVILWVENNHR
jgi:hypothetical protein